MAFTINVYLKLAIIAFGLIFGIVLWSMYGFWYGIWFVIIGIVMLASYVLLGTVQSAAEKMQLTDFDGVEKSLGLTLTPKLLYKTNRAYYWLLKGTVALNRRDFDTAERLFITAENTGLPSDQEKGMVQFQLASIAANKNNWTAAQNYFRSAKQYKITEPQLKEQMDQFEKVLKNRGMMKMGKKGQAGKGMYQPGGKRRRPRMR
jgi:hypothetical protein